MSDDVFRYVMVPHWLLDKPELDDRALRVYVTLGRYTNRNGFCSVKVSTLAEQTGKSEKTVRRALQSLQNLGVLKVNPTFRSDGSQGANDFFVCLYEPTVGLSESGKFSTRGDKPDSPRGTNLTALGGTNLTALGGTNLTRQELNNYELNEIELDTPYMSPTKKREELEQQFQQFWVIYPRHENQRRAFTSFRNALARGTPLETILTGAQRYAGDPNRVPQYTKHPATWLDNDCWTDDPLPARHQPPTRDIMTEIIDDLTRGPYSANFGNSHLLPSTPTWQWETDQPTP